MEVRVCTQTVGGKKKGEGRERGQSVNRSGRKAEHDQNVMIKMGSITAQVSGTDTRSHAEVAGTSRSTTCKAMQIPGKANAASVH